MNLGKKYGWDNIPYQGVYLSTGQCIGVWINGIEFREEEEEEE